MKETGQLFLTFLKIGSFTFGGGYAMIPAIRRETVDRRGWVTENEIADCIAISQSLPGVFSVNVAIFIGRQIRGVFGGLAACFGVVIPAVLSILAILMLLTQIEDNVYVLGALEGIKAASVGLILVTTFSLAKTILKKRSNYVMAIASFALIVLIDLNAIVVILIGGLYGYLNYQWKKRGEDTVE